MPRTWFFKWNQDNQIGNRLRSRHLPNNNYRFKIRARPDPLCQCGLEHSGSLIMKMQDTSEQ